MKIYKKLAILLTVFTLGLTLSACDMDSEQPVQFAAGDWASILIHNEIAMYIVEQGYGVEAEQTITATPVQIENLRNGSFHVNLEMWKANLATYDEDTEQGYYHQVSVNFEDPGQGIWIPQYLQDSHEIYTLQDLIEHKDLFLHPETNDPDKGLIYGGPEGWAATDFLVTKFSNEEAYGDFVDNFEFIPMGSTATLNTALQNAYDNEEPWAGYHWAPTWPHAVMDLVYLPDEVDYDPDVHEEEALGDLPAGNVTVVVTDSFEEDYPEIYEFISNYATSTELTSEMILQMVENEDWEEYDVAIWFLQNYEDVWSEWVPEDVAQRVNDALENE